MKLFFVAVFTVFGFGITNAQTTPFVLAQTERFRSTVLDEERVLNIYTPPAYQTDSTKNFPVIYLLDGSAQEDFIHVVGILQFMDMMEILPPHMLVGIGNVNRQRDFTYPSTVEADQKLIPHAGGSARFMQFLEKELLPRVQKNYRVQPGGTLIGQSLGGLVATEILLRKPQLFTRYIIMSPSLWWDNEALLKEAKDTWKPDTKLPETFVAVGKEGPRMEHDAARLAALLRQTRTEVSFETFPKETHGTLLHNALYKSFLKWKVEK